MAAPTPYKTSPVFDQDRLPPGLRREHSTKQGIWGVVRLLEGRLRLFFPLTGEERLLSPGVPGLVRPAEPHLAEPLGAMRMQIEFYAAEPSL
jgi:tellurite resistance-related uncharacterized protein